MGDELRWAIAEAVEATARTAPRNDAARAWLVHALGRICLALRDPQYAPLLGPSVPGASLPLGARVPGTSLELEPATVAFNLGAMIRGERFTPADHFAALLAASDYAARHSHYDGVPAARVADLLDAFWRAALLGSALQADPRCRGDRWLHQRVADAAVASALLGATRPQQLAAALWAGDDGAPRLDAEPAGAAGRAWRWAAGENAARAVRHALAALRIDADETPPGDPDSRHSSGGAVLAPPGPPDICFGPAFDAALQGLYPPVQAAVIRTLMQPGSMLETLPVDEFIARLVRN